MTPSGRTEEVALTLASELLEVTRRTVETGTVRVATVTSSRDETVDLALTATRIEIERVPVNRFVDTMPVVRTEGETTVVPVVEEVIVKRLLLREEIRLVPTRTTRQHAETVTLRTQDVEVSRGGRPGTRDADIRNIEQQGDHDAE